MIYYVKSDGGNGDGLSDATAWSYSKLNNTEHGGNTILFKRGDKFYGNVWIREGTSSNPTIVNAYGTGANPIIHGYTTLTNWTSEGNGIYSSSVDVERVDGVKIDNLLTGAARYPKLGYLTFTGHNGNTSISGTTVGSIPFNPTGGELVIRKDRYVIDRHPITSRVGNTLNYSLGVNENNNEYVGNDGNGYFIQNHLSCVTQENEWYYDIANNKLYVHFGVSNPSSKSVKVSTEGYLLYMNLAKYIQFDNIDFEGGRIAVENNSCDNISFNKCKFREQAVYSIHGYASSNISMTQCEFKDILSVAVNYEYGNSNIRFDDNKVENIGFITGAGTSNGVSYTGVYIYGTNSLIRRNEVKNCGYNGIGFDGDDAIVDANFVDGVCTIKDDGGGIYTYIGLRALINNNIILNTVGCYPGAEWGYWEPHGKAAGIYLDNGTNIHDATVTNNFIANGDYGGIFVNNNSGNIIRNNVVYNKQWQLLMVDYNPKVRNLIVEDNLFIAKTAEQKCFHMEMGSYDDISQLGVFRNNVYARPIDDNKTFSIYRNYADANRLTTLYTLAEWQTNYNLDLTSSKSKVTINNSNDIYYDYNYDTNDKVVSGIYKNIFGLDQNTTAIPQYRGAVLFANATSLIVPDGFKLYKTTTGKLLMFNGKILGVDTIQQGLYVQSGYVEDDYVI